MKIEETSLPGVLLITPKILPIIAARSGKPGITRHLSRAGLPCTWVQDNFSVSKKNVVRGIHYQTINPQGKLVRVTHGAVLDVAVDLRRQFALLRRSCCCGADRRKRPHALDS